MVKYNMLARRDDTSLAGAVVVIAVVVFVYTQWLHVDNALIVGFTFLLVVLLAAATAKFWVAATVSVLAMVAFNFFFLPPVGTFYLTEPEIGWHCSCSWPSVSWPVTYRRRRVHEPRSRRTTTRTPHGSSISAETCCSTDSSDAMTQLAQFIAHRFGFDFAAICLPRAGAWDIHKAGHPDFAVEDAQLASLLARSDGHASRRPPVIARGDRRPCRKPRAAAARDQSRGLSSPAPAAEASVLDALTGRRAIAVERAHFRGAKAADLARQSEELKSALLASMAHKPEDPLTAIRVAAATCNPHGWPKSIDVEQSDLILAEVERCIGFSKHSGNGPHRCRCRLGRAPWSTRPDR